MRYKLLKDLPFAKAGTQWEWSEGDPDPETHRILMVNPNYPTEKISWDMIWGDPRESEWFAPVDCCTDELSDIQLGAFDHGRDCKMQENGYCFLNCKDELWGESIAVQALEEQKTKDLTKLKELHDNATSGEWVFLATGIDYGFVGDNGEETVLFGEQHYGAVRHDNPDAMHLVALHNAFPALYKELVASRRALEAVWQMTDYGDLYSDNWWRHQRNTIKDSYDKEIGI
jgi:hypothetical protein